MRRFPAPPGGAGPSTPHASRSVEAPMQYEWEKPREFPASPFVPGGGGQDDGERAKKRPHYEAMEVDTPPRPAASFPPSVKATSNPFGFGSSSSAPTSDPHPLSFDAKQFHPEQAFGLEEEVETNEVSMADEAEALIPQSEGEESKALTIPSTTARRRRTRKNGRKASGSRPTVQTDDEETDGEQSGEAEGFLGVLKSQVGRRAGEFSFQVHHHHVPQAPGGAMGGQGMQAEQPAPEKWLRSGTPYVLLGYLQFGSLALLAILILSLLLLFLYTLYHDIQARLSSLTVELRAEIIQCAKAYVDNRCAPETRIPAMESRCAGWEECMNREIVVVGKTRVVAETLAEVVNGFVDVLNLKTMLFVILTLGLTIYGSSIALSILPSRTAAAAPPPSPSAQTAPHFAHHPAAALGYGAPPGYPPYGLPYAAGAGWVVDNNGGRGEGKEQSGLGAPGKA
ncbi:hypothetical protein JCM8547_004218 [Rhodosporidiobolus lusitaniae]